MNECNCTYLKLFEIIQRIYVLFHFSQRSYATQLHLGFPLGPAAPLKAFSVPHIICLLQPYRLNSVYLCLSLPAKPPTHTCFLPCLWQSILIIICSSSINVEGQAGGLQPSAYSSTFEDIPYKKNK